MELKIGVVFSVFFALLLELSPSLASNCPALTLKNGRVRPRSRGRMMHFRCLKGFTRVGQRFSVCLKSGQWSQPTPTCVKRGCPKLTSLKNLKIQKMHGGGVLKFTCDVGLRSGPEMIMCDGTNWDQEPPKCLEGISMGCDFEDETLCGWSNDNTDDFDWTRNKGKTPTANTGPTFDHTTGTADGHYIFVESSAPQKHGHKARLTSPSYEPKQVEGLCLEFFYHMYGRDGPDEVGGLDVYMKLSSNLNLNSLDDDRRIFHRHANQGDNWLKAEIEIPKVKEKFKFVFEATKLKGWASDIALDDIKLLNCSEKELTTVVPLTTTISMTTNKNSTAPRTTRLTTERSTTTTPTTTTTTPTTTTITTTTPTTTTTTTPQTKTSTTTIKITTATTRNTTTTTLPTTTTTQETTRTPRTLSTTQRNLDTPIVYETSTPAPTENSDTGIDGDISDDNSGSIGVKVEDANGVSVNDSAATVDSGVFDDGDKNYTVDGNDETDNSGNSTGIGGKITPGIDYIDVAINNTGGDAIEDPSSEPSGEDNNENKTDPVDLQNSEPGVDSVKGGDSTDTSGTLSQLPLIIGVTASVIVVAVLIAVTAFLLRRRQTIRKEKEADDQMDIIVDYGETSLTN